MFCDLLWLFVALRRHRPCFLMFFPDFSLIFYDFYVVLLFSDVFVNVFDICLMFLLVLYIFCCFFCVFYCFLYVFYYLFTFSDFCLLYY